MQILNAMQQTAWDIRLHMDEVNALHEGRGHAVGPAQAVMKSTGTLPTNWCDVQKKS